MILNAILNGILYGGILALLAIGLNLMFGVVQIVHFFYGQLLMIGLYIIYLLVVGMHIPFFLACLIAVATVVAVNLLSHLMVVNPLLKAPLINQFLAMAAVMVILENLCLVIFGATYKGIPIILPILKIATIYIPISRLIAFVGSMFFAGLIYLFLKKTYIGLAIQAVSQDREIASFMAINQRLIYIITMALGAALAGITAAFFVPIYSVHPDFGGPFTVISFVIVVLGGMGNLPGGFLAAFIIGTVTMIFSTLLSSEFGAISAYLLFLLIIIVRPQGLLGIRART